MRGASGALVVTLADLVTTVGGGGGGGASRAGTASDGGATGLTDLDAISTFFGAADLCVATGGGGGGGGIRRARLSAGALAGALAGAICFGSAVAGSGGAGGRTAVTGGRVAVATAGRASPAVCGGWLSCPDRMVLAMAGDGSGGTAADDGPGRRRVNCWRAGAGCRFGISRERPPRPTPKFGCRAAAAPTPWLPGLPYMALRLMVTPGVVLCPPI